MSVCHDAYLFEPARFRDRLVGLLEPDSTRLVSTMRLRDVGLRAFQQNERVRELACEYGGWDERSLKELDGWDSDVWLALVLYDCIESVQPPSGSGLGSRWREAEAVLLAAEWSASDSCAAVHGHSLDALFAESAEPICVSTEAKCDLRAALGALRPGTAGSVGWLSHDDAAAFLARLRSMRQDHTNAETACGRLMSMFETAAVARTGLCLIKSG